MSFHRLRSRRCCRCRKMIVVCSLSPGVPSSDNEQQREVARHLREELIPTARGRMDDPAVQTGDTRNFVRI